jgi:hypothetical protein
LGRAFPFGTDVRPRGREETGVLGVSTPNLRRLPHSGVAGLCAKARLLQAATLEEWLKASKDRFSVAGG